MPLVRWVRSPRGLWLYDNEGDASVRFAIEHATHGVAVETGTVELGDNLFPEGWPR